MVTVLDMIINNDASSFQVNFEKEPRKRFLQLLGYDQTDFAQKVGDKTGTELPNTEQGVDANELAKRMQQLNTPVSSYWIDGRLGMLMHTSIIYLNLGFGLIHLDISVVHF
jgi:hypothetical protein